MASQPSGHFAFHLFSSRISQWFASVDFESWRTQRIMLSSWACWSSASVWWLWLRASSWTLESTWTSRPGSCLGGCRFWCTQGFALPGWNLLGSKTSCMFWKCNSLHQSSYLLWEPKVSGRLVYSKHQRFRPRWSIFRCSFGQSW